jgi:SAM-dependent methyltransferase
MEYYRRHAEELTQRYNSLSPSVVHSAWKQLLPNEPGLAADIGAGSGRDANWLAGLGWDVVAVEPEAAFRQPAMAQSHPQVSWLDDRLPKLQRLREADTRFNLIVVSAVWMHLSLTQREVAFRVLSNLLAPGGLLVISVRHEPDAAVREARGFYEVSSEELPAFAKQRALVLIERQRSADALGRAGVSWETLCFRLPDDGTGSLPLLRHIIVNDNKSASYKLGLLRTLIRIAEGAPGLVLSPAFQASCQRLLSVLLTQPVPLSVDLH